MSSILGQSVTRTACKGNCGREIRLDHPKGMLSWNKTGYCRKCLKKLLHGRLKIKINKEKDERWKKEHAEQPNGI
jgi:hypothetical protein